MTAMTHNTMTSWIETADERHFVEAAMFERAGQIGERHYLHLGATIARVAAPLFTAASAQMRHCWAARRH